MLRLKQGEKMKEYCPKCKKETEVKEVLEDLDKNTGVLVKALVCTKCGESLTEAEEYMRAQLELNQRNILKITRNIIKIGNSPAIRIPQEVLQAAKMHLKEPVNVYVNNKHQIIIEEVK